MWCLLHSAPRSSSTHSAHTTTHTANTTQHTLHTTHDTLCTHNTQQTLHLQHTTHSAHTIHNTLCTHNTQHSLFVLWTTLWVCPAHPIVILSDQPVSSSGHSGWLHSRAHNTQHALHTQHTTNSAHTTHNTLCTHNTQHSLFVLWTTLWVCPAHPIVILSDQPVSSSGHSG